MASDSQTTPSRSTQLSGWPTISGIMTSIGQCQRYHEYDTRPMHCSSGSRRMRSGPRGCPQPQAIRAAAATTGTAASDPGYWVASLKTKAETTTVIRPAQAPRLAIFFGSRAK